MIFQTALCEGKSVTIEEALKREQQAEEKQVELPKFYCDRCGWRVAAHPQSKKFNNRQKRPHFEHFKKSAEEKISHSCVYTAKRSLRKP